MYVGDDLDWMEKNQKMYDAQRKKYEIEVAVPLVPEISQLNFYSCARNGESAIVCALFKETKENRKNPFLHVLVWRPPNHATGKLTSPASMLLTKYANLKVYNGLSVQVSTALANPVTITEHYDAPGALNDLRNNPDNMTLSYMQHFSIDESGQPTRVEDPPLTQAEMVQQKQQELNSAIASTQHRYTSAVQSALRWSSDYIDNSGSTTNLPPSATTLVSLPPQTRIGGQPRAPQHPVDLLQIRAQFQQETALAFGVTLSQLGQLKTQMKRAQDAVDESLISRMKSMSLQLSEAAEYMYASTARGTASVAFRLQLGVSLPMLIELKKAEFLTKEEASAALKQTFGLTDLQGSYPVMVAQPTFSSEQNPSEYIDLETQNGQPPSSLSLLFPDAYKKFLKQSSLKKNKRRRKTKKTKKLFPFL